MALFVNQRQVFQKSAKYNNRFLENNYWRVSLLLVTGVFMGYTLQPVPKWLSHLFDTSYLLKFVVLFVGGSIALYPLTAQKVVWVTIGAVATLAAFYFARRYDQHLDKKNAAAAANNQQQQPPPPATGDAPTETPQATQTQQPVWLSDQIAAAEAAAATNGNRNAGQ